MKSRDYARALASSNGNLRAKPNSSGSSNDLDLRSIGADVLDHMSEGVSVFDEDGVIRYTNRAEDAMFGYARGELISHRSRSNRRARIGRITAKYFGNCRPQDHGAASG